jgi:hypothetical protein
MGTYIVWCPDDGEDGPDDGREFEAFDNAAAVEAWARRKDSHGADYDIVSGRVTPTVHVLDEDGTVQRFQVTGEAVPRYMARKLNNEGR